MLFSIAIAIVAQPSTSIIVQPAATAAGTQSEMLPATSPGQNDARILPKTVVQIEITETISSRTSKLGDTFSLKLAEPVVVDGRMVLPAGLTGRGEVTHAAKRGWGGRPGELIINARYVDCGEIRISLGHLHFGVSGQNNFGGAFAASQIIPLGQLMVSGKDASIPAGAKATAQIKAEVVIPAAQLCPLAG